MTTPKTYRATERGFDGTRVIEAGEIFTTTAPKGDWMEPIGNDKADAIEAAEIAADPRRSEAPDWDSLTAAQLQTLAADRKIPFEGLSKKALAAALRADVSTIR